MWSEDNINLALSIIVDLPIGGLIKSLSNHGNIPINYDDHMTRSIVEFLNVTNPRIGLGFKVSSERCQTIGQKLNPACSWLRKQTAKHHEIITDDRGCPGGKRLNC